MVVRQIVLSLIVLSSLLSSMTVFGVETLNSAEGPQTQSQREEEQIKNIGSISTARYIGGGILGTYLGLGLGHGVQGRFSEKGYIFLTGELVGAVAMTSVLTQCLLGAGSSCRTDSSQSGALLFYVGIRFWEIFDLWYTPIYMDRRLKEIRGSNPVPEVSLLPDNVGGSKLLFTWRW